MDANLFFSATAPVSKAGIEPASGTPPADKAQGGVEFTALVNDYLQGRQRQEIAASDSASGDLQIQPLGPEIDLITSGDPLPDLGSLAAFARAQGLDESAVHMLFGNLPAESKPGIQLATASALAAALPTSFTPIPDLASPLAWTLASDATGLTGQNTPLTRSVTDNADAQDASILANNDALAAPSSTDLAGAALNAALNQGLPLPASHQAVILPSSLLASAAPSGAAVQAASVLDAAASTTPVSVSVLSLQVAAKKSTAAPSPLAGGEGVDAVSAAGVDAAMTDTLRLKLDVSSQEITRQLAQMSGTSKQATWGTLTMDAASTQLLQSLSLLGAKDLKATLAANVSLGADAKDSALEGVGDLGADTAVPASLDFSTASPVKANSDAAVAGSAPSTAVLNQQRSEQYQQLAERLGEAMGQRLINQIKQGDWKLQLRLQPASLGRIDVELDMHQGGLDALFMSDTQSTRELLAQGMGKLRDTLSQSGMSVASVWVNGEQSQQSGGNPTPGRDPEFVSRATSKDDDISVSAASERRVSASPADGWDVLA